MICDANSGPPSDVIESGIPYVAKKVWMSPSMGQCEYLSTKTR